MEIRDHLCIVNFRLKLSSRHNFCCDEWIILSLWLIVGRLFSSLDLWCFLRSYIKVFCSLIDILSYQLHALYFGIPALQWQIRFLSKRYFLLSPGLYVYNILFPSTFCVSQYFLNANANAKGEVYALMLNN